MTAYNTDFLIASMFILLLVLWHFSVQKRPDDLNNKVFFILVVLSTLDVSFEMISTYFITSTTSGMVSTTIFYLFQALLPFALICYVCTLHDNRFISVKDMLISGIPTMILVAIILTNPFTGMLFYFDPSLGYVRGPWYMSMYFCALFHIIIAIVLIISWHKTLGKQKILILLEISLITGTCVVIQAINHSLLMTGFGLSLGIFALFAAINNPHASLDSLTGLYDKPYLSKKMNELIANHKSFHVITVYISKLDHINKVSGMQGGNELIHVVTDALQEICGDQVYHISGKRFLILAFSLQDYETYVNAIKENIQPIILNKIGNVYSPIVISGILEANKLKDDGSILNYTEYLISLSQKSEPIEIIQSDDQTLSNYYYNQKVEQYLEVAIRDDLFEINYQPVYSLTEHKYISLEALSRLKHPELGWISPDLFITIAEKNHLIDQITDLQFHRVCRFIKEHEEIMQKLLNVKLNLSPIDLLRSDCSEHFIGIIDSYGLPHSYFQFEITETVATEYSSALTNAIESFSKAGIGLCLDDFGSGYANFNTVTQLPFSVIKLDRSLLFNICTDTRTSNFYQSIVSVLQGMGYRIVSEGVETEEEVNKLSSWGVDMIQGYYFSKPLPKDKLLELLSKGE